MAAAAACFVPRRGRLVAMPPATAVDPVSQFYGMAGNAVTNGAAFRNSLADAGPMQVAASHFLAVTCLALLPPVVSGRIDITMRIVCFVFMPAFIFSAALDSRRGIFYPLPAKVATLIRTLVAGGISMDAVESFKELRERILTTASKLPAADRALDVHDVNAPMVDNTLWLHFLRPISVRGVEPCNSLLADLLCLIPGVFVDITVPMGDEQEACISSLIPTTSAAGAGAFQVCGLVIGRFRSRQRETRASAFVAYDSIFDEVLRLRMASAEERFQALFDRSYVSFFPDFLIAFPEASTGVLMRHAVAEFGLFIGVTGSFVDTTVSAIHGSVSSLLDMLKVETSATDTLTRMQVLVRLHRDLRGGRSVQSSSFSPSGAGAPEVHVGADSDQYDKLLRDPDFHDLHTRVVAAAHKEAFELVTILAGHKHPAGVVFMTTNRMIGISTWKSLTGVRMKAAWQVAFNRVLALDSSNAFQAVWGDMIPLTQEKPKLVGHLVQGELDQIDNFWLLCERYVLKTEGRRALSDLALLPNGASFWWSPEHLRLGERPMHIIFGFIGHNQSRSVAGSFREFYQKQIDRAVSLSRVPTNIVGYSPLVLAGRSMMTTTLDAFSQYQTGLKTRSFHDMTRSLFADIGTIATAVSDFDRRLNRLREQVQLSETGEADHQAPGVQPVVVSSLAASTPLASLSHSVGLPASSSGSVLLAGASPSVLAGGSVSVISGGSPLLRSPSLAGSISEWDQSVFRGWGDQAYRHGVAKTDFGIAFGNTGVSYNKGGAEFTGCLAGAAHNQSSKLRGKWCVDPKNCAKLGFNAHDRPKDASDKSQTCTSDFSFFNLPHTVDKSGWQWIVRPHELRTAPPVPSWGDKGPTGVYDSSRDDTEPTSVSRVLPESVTTGGAKGKGAGGKGRGKPGRGGREKRKQPGFDGQPSGAVPHNLINDDITARLHSADAVAIALSTPHSHTSNGSLPSSTQGLMPALVLDNRVGCEAYALRRWPRPSLPTHERWLPELRDDGLGLVGWPPSNSYLSSSDDGSCQSLHPKQWLPALHANGYCRRSCLAHMASATVQALGESHTKAMVT